MEQIRRTPPLPLSPSPRSQRRLQACERCWKRKQKCDRLRPICTACVEAQSPCHPRKVPLGSAAEKSSALSNAAVPNYIETLKRKADDLDGQVRRQRARLASDDCVGIPAQTTQRSPERTQPELITEPIGLTGQSSVQAAMREIGFLSRNAMAEPRDEARGFPQELAMSSMVKASLAISGEDPSQSLHTLSQKNKFASMMEQTPKLTREFATHCLERFCERIGVYCLYLDEGEMRQHFDSFFDSAQEQPTGVGGAFRDFNAYMVVAIGALASQESGVELVSSNFRSAAMQRFSEIIGSNDGIKVLHCMLLLIAYAMWSSLGGSAWHLVGIAMKKSVSYRFHKEPYPDSGLTAAQVDQRRNIFWSLYIVDRTISSVLDRPFSIEDDDISLRYPSNSPEESVDFRFQVLMHARLISNIRSASSRQPVYHYGNICYWRDIPNPLKESIVSKPPLVKIMKQLTCRAFVHLPQLRPPTNAVGASRSIPQDVLNSCREYIDAEYTSSEQGGFSGSFIEALDIFAAGLSCICIGRTQSLPGMPAETHLIGKCTALLTILGGKFPSVKTLRRVLWALQASLDDPVIDQLPEIVPPALQLMIKDFVRQTRLA